MLKQFIRQLISLHLGAPSDHFDRSESQAKSHLHLVDGGFNGVLLNRTPNPALNQRKRSGAAVPAAVVFLQMFWSPKSPEMREKNSECKKSTCFLGQI